MKKLAFHTQLREAQGQSLVELAISLTVILMLLSGAVDFGMAFFSYTALRDAAQEGAVYGSFSPGDPSGIIKRVRKTSTSPVDLTDTTKIHITSSLTNGPTAGCEGSVGGKQNGIQVSVKYDYPIIMPFLGIILGGQTIPLTATVTDTILAPMC
jgi:Flp pilus assembly protein TadG